MQGVFSGLVRRHREKGPSFTAVDAFLLDEYLDLDRHDPCAYRNVAQRLLARHVGQKKAREIWYLCRQYGATEALDMGLVNEVVPLEELEVETVRWCRRMLEHSPLALRMLKASMNAADDGLAGIQQLAGDATLLFYQTSEAQHGRDSYVNRTPPDFSQFPRRP